MFLKNVARGFGGASHWLGKNLNRGAHTLQTADRWLGKQINNVHHDYRDIKKYLIGHDPTKLGIIKQAFNELENHSLVGQEVNQARKEALRGLDIADKFLDTVGNQSKVLERDGFSKVNYEKVGKAANNVAETRFNRFANA